MVRDCGGGLNVLYLACAHSQHQPVVYIEKTFQCNLTCSFVCRRRRRTALWPSRYTPPPPRRATSDFVFVVLLALEFTCARENKICAPVHVIAMKIARCRCTPTISFPPPLKFYRNLSVEFRCATNNVRTFM